MRLMLTIGIIFIIETFDLNASKLAYFNPLLNCSFKWL